MIDGPLFHFDPTITFQNIMVGHPIDATSPLSIPSSSASPNAVPDASSMTDIHCRVCRRRYDGSQHFGIDICRACAAFFRRSVAVKKTFVCRRGTNNCALNTVSRKTTCQKCRWMRCLEVGLQIDLVSGHRSPDHGKSSSRDEGMKKDGDESDSSSEGKAELEMACSPVQFPVSCAPIHRPIATIGAPNLVTTKATLINKLIINYNEFSRNRLEVELSLPHMQQDSKMFGSTGIPIVKATREGVALIHQKQVELLHIFLKNTFDEYALCDEQEQKRICALFYPVLWELESSYWTYRNMPVNADSEFLLMCTQTTYIDVRDMRSWFGEGHDEQEVYAIQMRLQNLVLTARTSILERMHKIIIKEFEFITLLALHIWAQHNHRLSRSEYCADQIREHLFNDLHYSYHDGLKIDNYASRMGEIMCLYTDVKTADISSTIHDIFFTDLTAYINSR